MRKLKLGSDVVIGGVCSGISKYFKIDVVWLRLAFLLPVFFTEFPIILIYFILWIVLDCNSE